MKKVLLVSILSIFAISTTTGCGGSFLDGGLASEKRTPPVDIYGAPENAPSLNLVLSQDDYPDKSLKAAQLTTSWSFFNEDGTVTGYEADSLHALQLDEYRYDVTLKLDGTGGVVEMQFSDDFPPEFISVQLWEVESAYGGQDISDLLDKGKKVVLDGNFFDVTNKGSDYIFEIYAKWENNGSSWYAFYLEIDSDYAADLGGNQNNERVDLGCCVKDVLVRDAALTGENSVSVSANDFKVTLNSDKNTYSTTDIINIWGTLEYIGDNESITIWSGCPFMHFSIAGGFDEYDFDSVLSAFQADVLVSSTLEKGKVYHFDYVKSGGWDGNSPEAAFWTTFFNEENLILPKGEYTISLSGAFGLTENVVDSDVGLKTELIIVVA